MRRFIPAAIIVALIAPVVRAQESPASPSDARLPALERELAGPLGRQRLAELIREVRHLVDLEEARQADLVRRQTALPASETEARLRETSVRIEALTELESDLAERQAVVEATGELARIEEELDAETLPVERLEELLAATLELRKEVDRRVGEFRGRIEEIAQQTALLGPATAQETTEVAVTRAALGAKRRRLDQSLSLSRLADLRAAQLTRQLQARLQSQAATTLLQKEPGVASLIAGVLTEPPVWPDFWQGLVGRESGLAGLTPIELALAALCLLLALVVGGWVRRLCDRRIKVARHGGFGQEWLLAWTASLKRHAVPLAVVGTLVALSTQAISPDTHPPALLTLLRALLLLLVVRLVSHSVLAPFPPAAPFSGLSPEVERLLARRITYLAGILIFGYLLFTTARRLGMPAQPYLLARALFVVLLALNLYGLLRLRARLADNAVIAWSRALAAGLLVLIAGAELLGYRHLSGYLMRGLLGTLMVVPLFWLLRRLVVDLLARVGRGELSPLHRRLCLRPDQALPGLGWLHLLAGLVLWPGLALVLLRVWSSPTGFDNGLEHLRQGIRLGGLVLQPIRGVVGLAVLAVLMLATRWVSAWLETVLARHERLDPGARTASVTLIGYTGVIVAVTAAASTMGFSLTQVTVLFGALSVGIGFGLQNIVNNFVSGLILLFERPIQAGDWIKVGDTEGYVRRLSVRSTLIENLDRELIIIPNSDLLTKPVINRTAAAPRGGVSVVVGLPYGSEPQRVEGLLREAVATVPAVQADSAEVLLKGFGTQALQFEVRCRPRDEARRAEAEAALRRAVLERLVAAELPPVPPT